MGAPSCMWVPANRPLSTFLHLTHVGLARTAASLQPVLPNLCSGVASRHSGYQVLDHATGRQKCVTATRASPVRHSYIHTAPHTRAAASSASVNHAPVANHAHLLCNTNSLSGHISRLIPDALCPAVATNNARPRPLHELMKVFSALLGVYIRRGYHLHIP